MAQDSCWASERAISGRPAIRGPHAVRRQSAKQSATWTILELPTDLATLAARVPGLLDRLDELPQTYAHGDASPQNLLIPRIDRESRVVIDWGLEKPVPIGFDLGQLLIGLAHADKLAIEAMPSIEGEILPAYHEGARNQGLAPR